MDQKFDAFSEDALFDFGLADHLAHACASALDVGYEAAKLLGAEDGSHAQRFLVNVAVATQEIALKRAAKIMGVDADELYGKVTESDG